MTKRWPAVLSAAAASAVLAGVGMAGMGPGAALAAASQQPYTDIATINQGAPMNQFNTSGNVYPGLDVMSLGIFKLGTNMDDFYPALAQKWQINKAGTQVKVWLQPNARWSNGQQVTSTDVIDTMAIQFALGAAQGWDLGSVHAVNSKELVFQENPGSNYNLFANQVLSQSVAPASVYGHFLPKDIWILIKDSQYTGKSPALLAKAKRASRAITLLGTQISKYAPSADVSSGPYVIQSMNSGEAVLVKNKYFYDASNIHINQVLLRN